MRNYPSFLIYFTCISILIGCKTSYKSQVAYNNNIVIDNTIPVDSSIITFYTPFKLKLENEMNRKIGYSDNFLNKNRAQPEFLVGNFFADAMLEIGKSIDPSTQVAVATKDGIRTELKQGPITVGSMFELMPFENTITILELKGTDILELCQFIAKTGGQPIAGFTMKIKDESPIDIMIGNEPLDVTKTYKLATYDYLANGGDYIKGIMNPLNRTNTDYTVREQLIKYVEGLSKNGQTVNTKLDGRITTIK